MRWRLIPFFNLIFLCIIAGCSLPQSSGQKPLRIETHPVDAQCSVKGDGFTMQANAPADIVVPLSAAPFQIECETESGFKGVETLSTIPNPWSPLNIGFGFLKNSAAFGNRLPELIQVTLTYTEATQSEESDKPASKLNNTAIPKKEIQKAAFSKETKILEKTGLSAQNLAGGIFTQKSAVSQSKQKKIALSSASRVHLLSFKKRANAQKSLKTLWQHHNNILKGLSASIEVVDLGRKGRFHRIYAGPFKSYKAASNVCDALKNKGIYCRPVAAGAK